ncbi:MAG: DUF2480 family protein [Bacteroidetes bacterium]|nr:MAG: DUF2480 family protein [Bacteroidota bacterium]
MSEIVNRIANSPIITFKLEEHYPQGERVLLDIKDQLFQGMILRERDFRAWIKTHDWAQYQDQHVAIHCSTDAIVQTWAYMLLEVRLQPYARTIVFGTQEDLERTLWMQALDAIDWSQFADRPVVVKGCSTLEVPTAIYVEATRRLFPYAKKISYGEPCSTVPVYKAPG